jgi:colanic acid/amylovoran biosynthesis glycosyltransferase
MPASNMVPVCKALNIPLVVIFHGHDASDKKLLHKYKEKYQQLFAYATFIIAVSEEMKKRLINFGANPGKMRLVPYGINTSKFKPVTNVIQEKKFLLLDDLLRKKARFILLKHFIRCYKNSLMQHLQWLEKKSVYTTNVKNW